MSRGVSIVLRIQRSANNLGENSDIEGIDDQFIIKIEGSSIFEEEYINGILNPDISILTVFSISIFFNSFKLKILRFIIYVNFLRYIFFCFERCNIRFIVSSNFISVF